MVEAGKARVDQIVGECFAKAAHIILGARICQSSRTASRQGPKCWFNLEVEEVDSAARELEAWRRDPSTLLGIEIYLQAWPTSGGAAEGRMPAAAGDALDAGGSLSGRTLLERWTVAYSAAATGETRPPAGRPATARLEPAGIYKRLVIALRSLYSYVRVLPAFRLLRACKRERSGVVMQYRLLRGATPAPARGRLMHFAFSPIETPYGRLRMAVDYQASAAVTVLEQTTAPPPLPQIIADYVGRVPAGALNARLANPLFASMHLPRPPGGPPGALQDLASSPPTPGSAVGARGAAPRGYTPITRRASWSTHSLRAAAAGTSPPPPGGALHGAGSGRRMGSLDLAGAAAVGAAAPLALAAGLGPYADAARTGGLAHLDVQGSHAGSGGGSPGALAPVAAAAGLAARHARPWGLAKAPASAPAAPAMMPASPPQAHSRGGGGGVLGLPPPPPPLAPVPSGGSESGSSAASSGLPASCSPQLPFAFTPSAASTYSLSSLVGPGGHGGGSAGTPLSPALGAREGGAFAAARRPVAWSSPRSSAAFELAPPGTLGYSVSPLQSSLEASLLSGSTPRHAGPALPSPPAPLQAAGSSAASGGSYSSSSAAPRAPPGGSDQAERAASAAVATEDAESDPLPFALDADAPPSPITPERAGAAAALGAGGLDDAVGAFVRLLQDAPPLQRGDGADQGAPARQMTLAEGLEQVARIRAQLPAL
ncbi:hypothetical protein WJX81_005985 [Elliptochloris bilobata]|uniref:Autophagy-related protein 13 N-terminal domain-containing protein n=1 Tax=Elliptochloris bilobata TaxID=381761 RepID=A0AAW1S0U7_9CHLO